MQLSRTSRFNLLIYGIHTQKNSNVVRLKHTMGDIMKEGTKSYKNIF